MTFDGALRAWDGEFLASRFVASSDAWILVGVHSTALGPSFGGTRMKAYPDLEAAVRDVLRLSQAMTFKNAMAGLPFGGGKAVVAVLEVPQGDARRALLERYADLLGALGGSYVTACDMNTSELDMDVLAERCPHVMGTSRARGGSGSSAPDTARGVHHAIRAALGHRYGSEDLAGRRVVIQGAGAVGAPLAAALAGEGADLVLTDVQAQRAETLAAGIGARTVPAGQEYDVECDVFAPCGTGGVLTGETIARLRCSIIVGAANNQLGEPADADRLRAAGILYSPDYVVNAGGVLHLAGVERLGWSDADLSDRLAGIGDTLRAVLAAAEAADITPSAAADRIARDRIQAARRARAAEPQTTGRS